MLIIGSIIMCVSMIIVGIIVALYRHDWPHHAAAGWSAVGKYLRDVSSSAFH